MTEQESILLWTALAALAAGMSAVAAAFYTGLTYRLVRLQSDPKVIVYSRPDLDRPSIISLIVENIGRDVAYDVRFSSSRPIPMNAFGIEFQSAAKAEVMKEGPLIEGIPQLGPGSTREITWGQFGGLVKAIGDEPLNLTFTYRCGRHKFSGNAMLECRSYYDTNASRKPMVVVADAIQKIEHSLHLISSSASEIAKK